MYLQAVVWTVLAWFAGLILERESKHTAGGLSMPARVASDAFYGALYSA